MTDYPTSEMVSSMQLTSRSKLLFLIGVFLLPVVAAYLAYAGWRPAGHSNYGDLLKVTPLQQTAGSTYDGRPFDLNALHGKWVMVHVGPARCDEACAWQLYLMRQTRIAQGKEQDRIERLWVMTDNGTPDAQLLQAHPDLHVWRPAVATFAAQFPAARDRSEHIYLVDPLGNLMLRFPAQVDAKRMMQDLKLLLKASQIG
jgi:cytochrome oxidase Cu insertion factor (SCO1/SenC/PrrC family)